MGTDLLKVFEWNSYYERAGSRDEDAGAIRQLHDEAIAYLTRFRWCARVRAEYIGFAYPGIVAVFLFEIEPARSGVDEWVWIIVGDLPPAYITCEQSPNPASALDAYVGAMQEWVDAVRTGSSTDELIPVNVSPTTANAERLATRLKLLDEKILSGYADDLRRE